jgi:hypothetical protein
MPSFTVAVPNLATDPGYLWAAPLGTAEPASTVAASVFSVAWSTVAAWVPLGATEEGNVFSFQTTTEPITVAEFVDPLQYKTSGRTGSISFALSSVTASNIKRAFNGGTLSTESGSTTTLSTKYVPPTTGAETRLMIGWESQDSTERLFIYQSFNTGQVTIPRRKGADNASIACEFSIEQPSSGAPFAYYSAGTARLGA